MDQGWNRLPTKFWQNVFFWFGSLVFSFLPLILAVSPDKFPFGGFSTEYVFGTKYSDVLTIVFVFVCIAFFDLLDVALALRHSRVVSVLMVLVAIILLLASFATVVVSHTHEAAKQRYETVKVQTNKEAFGFPAAGAGISQNASDGYSKFSGSTDPDRNPGKVPTYILLLMFFITGACKAWQAMLDGRESRAAASAASSA